MSKQIYRPAKNKGIAILLALLLGGIGAHHFYTGRTFRGLLYLLFFWTFIPIILSFIDIVLYLMMPGATFQRKFA